MSPRYSLPLNSSSCATCSPMRHGQMAASLRARNRPKSNAICNCPKTATLPAPAVFSSPRRIFPPLFNRYEGGMTFGSHIDNAVRRIAANGERVRTDLSATLFLSDPDAYDGGELVIEDTYGERHVKLAAGDLVLYPGT